MGRKEFKVEVKLSRGTHLWIIESKWRMLGDSEFESSISDLLNNVDVDKITNRMLVCLPFSYLGLDEV